MHCVVKGSGPVLGIATEMMLVHSAALAAAEVPGAVAGLDAEHWKPWKRDSLDALGETLGKSCSGECMITIDNVFPLVKDGNLLECKTLGRNPIRSSRALTFLTPAEDCTTSRIQWFSSMNQVLRRKDQLKDHSQHQLLPDYELLRNDTIWSPQESFACWPA